MLRLLLTTCFFGRIEGIFNDPPERSLLNEYDFVVIGSGSAGCAVANRLSEVPEWKVLLLEAGKRPGIIHDIPILAQGLQATDYNWQYRMERTPNACLGSAGQRCTWPRGKGLGGTSLINYMIYTRGNKRDFDKWAEAGNPGWSFEDILPYYKKSEASTVKIQDEGYHNKHGPLSVEDVNFRNTIVESFIQGGNELGYPLIDYNGKSQDGFSYVQANTKRGRRHSGYRAFIEPAEGRSNLHVSTRTRVTKILTDPDGKAYGVKFAKNRQYYHVNASKEVILSAGTFNSPQLLMLSGIGPKNHLESLGIDVIKDLPGVGKNMKDHMTFIGTVFKLNASVTEGPYQIEDPRSLLQWLLSGTGPMTDIGGVSGLGYIHTNITNLDVPDVELIFMSGKNTPGRGHIFQNSIGMSQEVYDAIWKPLEGGEFWGILPMLLHPNSVGHIELRSKNPFAWPELFGNYLSDEGNLDVKRFIAAVRFVQKLAKTEPFGRYGSELHDIPVPGCKGHVFDTDEYWECAVRHVGISLHHQTGTCKMGPKSDPMAVVDHLGQVYGVENLRVADCSIIPEPLSAHTNGPAFMIGEKISDEVKKRWRTS